MTARIDNGCPEESTGGLFKAIVTAWAGSFAFKCLLSTCLSADIRLEPERPD